MPISRARLDARRAEVTAQIENLKQQFTALTGVLADIDFWLAEEAAEVKDETDGAGKL